MKWESIEAKWSEMARRALGADGGSETFKSTGVGLSQAQPEDTSVIASAVTAALATVTKPERSVA